MFKKLYGIIFFSFVCAIGLSAQIEFDLANVIVADSNRNLVFKVKAIENNNPSRLRADELKFYETVEGEQEQLIELRGLIKDEINYKKIDVSQEIFWVLFLVDISQEMSSVTLNEAKQTIKDIVKNYAFSKNIKFVLKTYEEEIYSKDTLTNQNVEGKLNLLKRVPKNPDLYRLLSIETESLKRYPDNRIIFLFSDGINNTEGNPNYRIQQPMESSDVLSRLEKLDEQFFIFPIGSTEADGLSFLQSIPQKTPALADKFGENLPSNLQAILKNNQVLESTHSFQVSTNKPDFLGEKRTYKVQWEKTGVKEEKTFLLEKGKIGSLNTPLILGRSKTLTSWIIDAILGLITLTVLLGGFSLVVPVYRKEQFKKKFVKPYVPEPNIRRIDPVLMEPIQEGELIVQKCQQIVPLQTWIDLGWQCPNYEDCINKNGHRDCKGGGAPDNDYNFFGMQGIYRQLNWLWFGMAGGFLGWLVFALFEMFDLQIYDALLKNIYNGYSQLGLGGNPPNFRDLSGNTIMGIGFGLFAVMMLAWVEERSQSRKTSWGRILLRTALGGLAAFFIFAIGFYFHYANIIPNIYANWLLTWLAFGMAVGLILSIKSSISTLRGVLGGAISGGLAFLIYIFFAFVFSDFGFSKLISLLVMGGILGVTLNTIVSAVEDFELEFITPKAYNRIVPISKWLKTGITISVGRAIGSYVYIRWDDNAVAEEHAELSYDKTNVFINPRAETLVNGRILPMNQKMALKDGDIIHLGRNSITQIRYKEKRQMSVKAKR